MRVFSPAQIVGYLSFVLGVTAFLQRSDRRLKFFNASESLTYAVHFALLGNLPAAASALISCTRSFLALKLRSAWLAVFFIAINLGVGAELVKRWTGWLPICATCSATVAIFLMKGVPMRITLLGSTLLWLANNIISHSIGGTMLETTIATVNTLTIIRLLRTPAMTTPTRLKPNCSNH